MSKTPSHRKGASVRSGDTLVIADSGQRAKTNRAATKADPETETSETPAG